MNPTERVDWDLAADSDADLLTYMAMAAEDPPAAQQAWEAFYRRHVEYLYAVCLRAYGPLLGGDAGAADLTADTFRRAYEHAGTFAPGDDTDGERQRLRVRGWLGRIAQRLAQGALRNRGKLPLRMLPHEQWGSVAEPKRRDAVDSDETRRVREAMGRLTPREQIVLRTTFQWYQADRDHQRLPNDVAAELAETLETTPENLRQIRRRALKKIEAVLREKDKDD